MMTATIILLVGLALAVLIVGVPILRKKPSLTRDWSPDQAVMPSIEFSEHEVRIKNIRRINYRTTRDYDLAYYDKTIQLSDVESAWFVISPFGRFDQAHTFVSFGFKDGTYLSISVEVRRKKGQKFSGVKAFFRQFEIMYVLADESDVIKVRTNTIKATVLLYPVKTEADLIRVEFVDMLKRADKLGKAPEFYNTIWNNCTTNIVRHVRRFSDKPIPTWSISYLLPGDLDEIAYRLDMIDTNLPLEEAREFFNISDLARSSDKAKDFSRAIRANILGVD